jgi:hypothetical protein
MDQIDGPVTPRVGPESAWCYGCGAGHDDARQEMILRLRRQLAAGAYQPPLAELVDRLVAIVARQAELGPGPRR